jgi:hypothetical protein
MMIGQRTVERTSASGRAGRVAVAVGLAALVATPGNARAGDDPQTVPNPPAPAILLARTTLSIPANPIPNFAFRSEDLDEFSGEVPWDFTDPAHMAGNEFCAIEDESGDYHPYTTDTVRILEAGTYTFRIVNSPGVRDPFLALYEGTVDKANPDAGVIGCNDDIDNNDPPYDDLEDGDLFDDNGFDDYDYPELDEYFSLFEVELQPGTYTIMLTTFSDFLANDGTGGDDFWYDGNGDSGVGSGAVGSQSNFSGTASTVFEYWGIDGGLERISGGSPSYDMDGYLEHLTERGELADSDLPNTGSSKVALNLATAVAFLGSGSILIAVSRRRRLD